MMSWSERRDWRWLSCCIIGAGLCAACGSSSAPPPVADVSSSSDAAATVSPAASTVASTSEPAGGPRLRISRDGVDYQGAHFDVLVGGYIPTDPDGVARVKPAVSDWLKRVDGDARARHTPGTNPVPMPVTVAVLPDVHPTTVLDVLSLLPAHSGGVYSLELSDGEGGVSTPLTTYSTKGTPGPAAPEGWGCANISQPNLPIALVVPGDKLSDGADPVPAPTMLRHDGKGKPDWSRFEQDVKAVQPDATCVMWVGAGDALSFGELVHGIEVIQRIRGRQLPLVYIPFDGPEE